MSDSKKFRIHLLRDSVVVFFTLATNGGGMKRADVERFKLYIGLSRHVLYRVL